MNDPGFVPRDLGPKKPPRPTVPPHVRQIGFVVPWRGLRIAGYVLLCLAALALTGAIGYGLGGGGCAPLPVPPAPTPTPVGELRVILVSDTAANMTKGQLSALASSKVRAYLDAHCGKDKDHRPAWRSWDKDQDAAGESDTWREAWDAAKPMLGELPQVVIFHGQKGKAYPLPDSPDGLVELLAKHGGK